MITVSGQLRKVPSAVRPTVQAAIEAERKVVPNAEEIAYQMEAPRSERMMWKIVRFAVNGENVVGVGTFPRHSTIFFYRGRELDDGTGLLQGSGKATRFVFRSTGDDLLQGLVELHPDRRGARLRDPLPPARLDGCARRSRARRQRAGEGSRLLRAGLRRAQP